METKALISFAVRLKIKFCLFVLFTYLPTFYPPTQKIMLPFPEEKYVYFPMAEMCFCSHDLCFIMPVSRLIKVAFVGKSVCFL